MEAPGGGEDGASEISYESVASEGGLEYGERGRDQRRQIISSSHCVQVFQSLYDIDGAYCERGAAPPGTADGGAKVNGNRKKGAAGAQEESWTDPLCGLPPRIMRFDGAMEAWTEEIPLSQDPAGVPGGFHRVQAYTSLNDASMRTRPSQQHEQELQVLQEGNRRAIIWYFTQGFCADLFPCFLKPGEVGLKKWQRALLENGFTIDSTHVEVGRVNVPPAALKGEKGRSQWLKSLFSALQVSKWSPAGEAGALQVRMRLSHVSMSIGDIVQIGRHIFVACLDRFVCVHDAGRLLPAGLELTEEELSLELEDLEEAPPKKKSGKNSGAQNGANDGAGGDGKGGQRQGGRKGGKGNGGDAAAPGTARGGKKGKGKGKAQGKGKDDGQGGGAGQQRAAEPGPSRADRRNLRTQLQAKRESLQGN